MTRDSAGNVEFVDLDTLQPSLIVVSPAPDGGLALWMDQNNTGESGWGGDCDVGFDHSAAEKLLDYLRLAKKIADGGPKRGWGPVGPVAYSWCDRDGVSSKPGGSGHVSIFARREVVRIIVSPKGEFEPYSFTLPLGAVSLLIELVQVALAT